MEAKDIVPGHVYKRGDHHRRVLGIIDHGESTVVYYEPLTRTQGMREGEIQHCLFGWFQRWAQDDLGVVP